MKTVNREQFVNWMLEDTEDFLAQKQTIINSLLGIEEFNIETLFDSCGYIPDKILNNPIGDDKEYCPNVDCILEPLESQKHVPKTLLAKKVLQYMDDDFSYEQALEKVLRVTNMSKDQLEKELEPFI